VIIPQLDPASLTEQREQLQTSNCSEEQPATNRLVVHATRLAYFLMGGGGIQVDYEIGAPYEEE
jgi:hypothetical protein